MSYLMFLVAQILPVMAQAAAVAELDIPDVKPDKPWLAILIAVVLAMGAVAASVMTPKRTHQD